MKFNLSNQDGSITLSMFGEGDDDYTKVVSDTHPNFDQLLTALRDKPQDEERIKNLADPTRGLSAQLAEISDRVTADTHNVYLDGQRIHNSLSEQILKRLQAGDQDWSRFVKFMLNLDDNPSYQAQQSVHRWIQANGLTITPDGNFIGYKGVQKNGMSVSSGPNNYVDGVLYQKGADTRVPHEIGSVISKKRHQVDDDTRSACSVGLHVGTEKYARDFAPRLLTVEINPRDVVSVPDNDLEWKIRVCQYKVLALADPMHFEQPSFDPEPLTVTAQEVKSEEDPVQTALDAKLTLAENAALDSDLKADLENPSLGHKAVGRKWASITTEASVRRYRKATGVKMSFGSKVKDVVS